VDLTPLADGGLYERLNNVLDGRGEPRVPFDLHAIDAAAGGIYLVLQVYTDAADLTWQMTAVTTCGGTFSFEP
jgi:hypothetical protein